MKRILFLILIIVLSGCSHSKYPCYLDEVKAKVLESVKDSIPIWIKMYKDKNMIQVLTDRECSKCSYRGTVVRFETKQNVYHSNSDKRDGLIIFLCKNCVDEINHKLK